MMPKEIYNEKLLIDFKNLNIDKLKFKLSFRKKE